MKTYFLLAAILILADRAVMAQEADLGRKIYAANAPSVLLLYVRTSDGQYIAQGSGFLVDGPRIVTNAHVATGGRVYIDLGTARVPTSVEKVDSVNDLAILETNVELNAKPLKFADAKPSPGDLIFSISNPEGLERTISQGVVSGERDIFGRKLLQISTPISHGSSGGPICNRDGLVVGVAVGTLRDGQNLNFAVPIEKLKNLLSRASTSVTDLESIAQEVASLQTQQADEKYSNDPDSGFQKKQRELENLLNSGVTIAGNNPEALVRVAQLSQGINVDIALDAARRAVQARPSEDTYLLLANVLNSKYIWLEGDERHNLMKQAEDTARLALKSTRTPTAEMYYRLGDTLEDEGKYSEAETVLHKVLGFTKADSTSPLYFQAVRNLMLCATGLDHPEEEKRWFAELEAAGQATAYDWHNQAAELYKRNEFEAAGQAYSRATTTYKRDWCTAGLMYDLATDADSSLFANRKCIEVLTGIAGSESDLASAHVSIAGTLNNRGVYSEALGHAKEAITLDPSNSFAFSEEANALNNLQRFNESITASKEALRLSDGKYAFMHFALGSSYFELENWELSRQSFEKAAELNQKDDVAAYNVAVCYARQSYFNDAALWYEEALRRNANRTDRDELRRRINTLRR